MDIRDHLTAIVAKRSAQQEQKKKYYEQVAERYREELKRPKREFKPLPSDMLQDPSVWSEWKLNERMEVVKK